MKSPAGILSLCLASMAIAAPARAQITAANDGTNTAVIQTGNAYAITGGTRSGNNLFQSFQQFGVNQGQSANFIANPAIQNILGRVTGGSPSVINGLIQVLGSSANLYLMNPAGIVFGANASLNVSGSFTATTANGIEIGNQWFNAVGMNDYAALAGVPSGFAFTMTQPGAVINTGNLVVGQGQSLTLLGGTVISTGTLTAPGGTITVAAVSGEQLVHITQAGSLLSLDLPIAPAATINPLPFTPLSLPQLLTGGSATSATGVTVENGVVRLTGTDLTVQSGTVVATAIAAQTATLSASHDLALVESQLHTTADLNLLATNTIQMRDSATRPLLIRAGGQLTVQGNQGITIAALNQPASGLFAAGDLVLRSAGSISGDAHYTAGGNFRIERLNGSAGNWSSQHDPVIRASGNVNFTDYTGPSLHIFAGGSVTVTGAIAINDIDPTNFINEVVTLSDGTAITINGSARPTLDIRAGTTAVGTPLGLTGAPSPTGLTFPGAPTAANITIGSIQVDNSPVGGNSGVVFLTTQYAPNGLPGGAIWLTQPLQSTDPPGINLNPNAPGSTSGLVAIDSRATITLGAVDANGLPARVNDGGGTAIPAIQTQGSSVILLARGAIATGALSTGGQDQAGDSFVRIRSGADVVVRTVVGGAGGVDITAAGAFQAIDILDNAFFNVVTTLGTNPGLLQFVQSKLPPNTVLSNLDLAAERTIAVNNLPVSILARPIRPGTLIPPGTLNAPIRIQYGAGSRTQTSTFDIYAAGSGFTPADRTVGQITLQGNSAFNGGPTITPLVNTPDRFVLQQGANFTALTAINPNNPANPGDPNNLDNTLSALVLNQGYSAFVFGSATFPTNTSGTVGAIAIGAGTDAGIYGNTQNRVLSPFTPVVATPPDLTAGRIAQQQLNGQPSACGASGAIAALPNDGLRGSTTGTAPNPAPRVGSAVASATPCTPTANDTQILKLLGE